MDRDKPLILTGTVVHGKAIGRTVGMPTANIAVSDACNLPEYGVYATRLLVHGKTYQAVTNIGLRPTVDDKREVTVEAHVLDFSDDILLFFKLNTSYFPEFIQIKIRYNPNHSDAFCIRLF